MNVQNRQPYADKATSLHTSRPGGHVMICKNSTSIQKGCVRLCLSVMVAAVVLSSSVAAQANDEVTNIRRSVLATLKYHPQLKARAHARSAAEQDMKEARGGFFPRLDVSGGYGLETYSDPNTRRDGEEHHSTDRFDSSITATQLLFDGFGTPSRLELSKAALRSSKDQFLDAAESLSLDAIIAHLDVFRQRRLVELAEDNVAQHEEILSSMEERQRLGGGSLADVTQTRGRLARALTTLSQTQSDLHIAEASYLRLTGITPSELEDGETPEAAPQNIDTAVANTMSDNNQISALQNELEVAAARIDVTKSTFMPTVNLQASSTYSDNANANTWHTINNQVMVRLNWNLLRGGSDLAALRATKARRLQARMNLEDTKDRLRQEVAATWSQYKSALEQAALYEEAVEYNRQTRDMYIQQFNVNQRSLLDVLDAENELFNAQGQLITAGTNVVIGAYRLLALEGALLDSLDISSEGLEVAETAKQ